MTRIEATDFCGSSFAIAAEAKTLFICGENAMGKTNVLRAVQFALTGRVAGQELKKDAPLLSTGKQTSVVLELGGKAIKRTMTGSVPVPLERQNQIALCVDTWRFFDATPAERAKIVGELVGPTDDRAKIIEMIESKRLEKLPLPLDWPGILDTLVDFNKYAVDQRRQAKRHLEPVPGQSSDGTIEGPDGKRLVPTDVWISLLKFEYTGRNAAFLKVVDQLNAHDKSCGDLESIEKELANLPASADADTIRSQVEAAKSAHGFVERTAATVKADLAATERLTNAIDDLSRADLPISCPSGALPKMHTINWSVVAKVQLDKLERLGGEHTTLSGQLVKARGDLDKLTEQSKSVGAVASKRSQLESRQKSAKANLLTKDDQEKMAAQIETEKAWLGRANVSATVAKSVLSAASAKAQAEKEVIAWDEVEKLTRPDGPIGQKLSIGNGRGIDRASMHSWGRELGIELLLHPNFGLTINGREAKEWNTARSERMRAAICCQAALCDLARFPVLLVDDAESLQASTLDKLAWMVADGPWKELVKLAIIAFVGQPIPSDHAETFVADGESGIVAARELLAGEVGAT